MLHAAVRTAVLAAITALVGGGALPAPATTADAAGNAFTVRVREKHSARAAFREAARALNGGRLQGLVVRSALADRNDRFVQGFVSARSSGTPVAGVLFAGTSGVVGAVTDTPDRLGQSYPALIRRLQRMLPARASSGTGASSAAAVPLHTVSFGTGTIGLPATWSVANSYQGCVEATSASDHGYLAFGCPQAAVIPPLLPGTDPRQVLVLRSDDPVAALGRVIGATPPAGLGLQAMRVVEAQPVASPMGAGRAAYVLFDYRANGAPFRGLALVAVAPVGGSLMVYKSMFMLPHASFPRLAPVMWRSWQSWGVSSGVLNARLASAAQSMRETGDIITGAYWDRQHANAQTSLGFSEYLRDTAQLEDTSTGRRYEGSYFDASTIVQNNPVKYRIVPIGELTP